MGDLPLTLTVALTTGQHYFAACDHSVLEYIAKCNEQRGPRS